MFGGERIYRHSRIAPRRSNQAAQKSPVRGVDFGYEGAAMEVKNVDMRSAGFRRKSKYGHRLEGGFADRGAPPDPSRGQGRRTASRGCDPAAQGVLTRECVLDSKERQQPFDDAAPKTAHRPERRCNQVGQSSGGQARPMRSGCRHSGPRVKAGTFPIATCHSTDHCNSRRDFPIKFGWPRTRRIARTA